MDMGHEKQQFNSEKFEVKKTLRITGMTCANCARIVEKSISKVEGVKFAAVNLATNTAFVILENDIPEEILINAVENVGYGVSKEPVEEIEAKRLKYFKKTMVISLAITIPLMLLMMIDMFFLHIPFFREIELILSGIVIFYAGYGTIRGALIAILHKHFNMDSLIFFGSVTAWLTNILSYVVKVHPFGTIGAMILSLHLIGRFIESNLRDKASKQIRELIALQQKEARVITREGEFLIPIEAVKENDVVLVMPNERIPVDGVIIEGLSTVDESMITGESLPVTKSLNDMVVGGSLNLSSVLKVKVTKTGEDTFLSKMIALVQEAQGAKIPIQALADRITNWFVPGIILLALLSSILWYFNFDELNMLTHPIREYLPWMIHVSDKLSFSIFIFLSTVVIACPCALGLATPMALIVGTSLAASKGLLIRNAEAIQTIKNVGYILLDKTGTITQGKPEVIYFEKFQDISQEELKKIALIESYSNHPLAKAIVEYLTNDKNLEFLEKSFGEFLFDLQEIPGEGIVAKIGDDEFFIGKARDIQTYSHHTLSGKSIVEVVKNGVPICYFAIADKVREDARYAIGKLKEMGIKPVMVTGDNENTAKYIAKIVGIEEIYAGAKPEDKLNIVRKYQAEGKKVIMVGDGINDAAALKSADIGIALGSGSDLAIDSSDIIITKGGISRIVDAIFISKTTFKSIKQNLTFAFFYNILAIPLAMLGFLHPAIAESAMALSSITVILNSLRVRKEIKKVKIISHGGRSCCS
ncbi:MAG: heavy metal translocating P-type ATPase [Fervidobacterium sp.]